MKRNHLIFVLCLSVITLFIATGMAAGTKTFNLGTSSFTIEILESYVEGERTQEDIADDMVAYMKSADTLLDFDVYQFSKEGYPDTLAGFATQEGGKYKATEIKTDDKIGDIPVAWYRAVETFDGQQYNTITYIIEDGNDYLEVSFWLDGENAEQEAKAIIETLKVSAK